ncbi:rRNA pseudouridine synthase [Candidatus Peregrinibacteria bacterium]|nr:rRNA pseudouridine synthase [Candidatus Peregrinibacteria bacterium]MBT7736831.1 rRNA pseudouridine synthase [Candidatus Peregrinibacteria bacterium]
MQLRLNKFISENTKYSRRKVDELIKQGEVFINKNPAKIGEKIDPDKDTISINGKKVKQDNKKIYLALNKPKGYITTRKDEKNRQTVMDLVPKIKNLKPVGRLDKETEGLLLLSNDGDFIYKLTHPSFECEKEYEVTIKGPLSMLRKRKLEKGIMLDGKKTYPSEITIKKSSETETTLTIKIHEGRNRQIRKMFAQVKCPVKYLTRLRIGKITLSNLKKGAHRNLTSSEINVN